MFLIYHFQQRLPLIIDYMVFSPQLCKMKVLPQFVPTLVKFQLGLSLVSTLEDKLKAFDDFKYKQKSA